jgi:hypothetical protein
MLKKLLLTLTIITLCTTAHARREPKDDYDNFNSDGEDYSDFNSTKDDPYRDWNSVLTLLASKGVNSNRINWGEVEASCQQIKATASDVKYNKCKYENAIKYNKYQKDSVFCKADAEQKYYRLGMSKQDSYSFKNSAFITCMRKTGWSDPGSWMGGKYTNGNRRR